jgi:predicted phosphodiesterase
MRLAVLADVHGNLPALEAVLADARQHGFDLLLDLGDAVSGPLWPAETIDLLTAAGALGVRGNHDRVVAEDGRADMPEGDAFAHDRLSAAERTALGARPTMRRLDGVLAMHGTPASDMDYLLHEAHPDGVVRERRPDEVAALLQGLEGAEASLILCGHTHRAHALCLPDGRMVVNPGSVGQPAYVWDVPVPHRMEAGAPHARWAMLEREPAGWQITFRMVAYDWERAAAEAARNHFPRWAHSLKTGTTA